MFRANGTQANLGYGDYLVTAEIVKPRNATFATYDPNVALGMFTYDFYDTNWNHLPQFAPHAGPTDGDEVEVVIRNFEFQQP